MKEFMKRATRLFLVAVMVTFAITMSFACVEGDVDPNNDDDEIVDLPTSVDDSIIPLANPDKFSLVWADYFTGPTLDTTKWTAENKGDGFGNQEIQFYNGTQNILFRDNAIVFQVKREAKGNCSFTSAKISTQNKFSQTYGRFEARIKMTAEQGLWPAFWMLGYGKWPQAGEIDIMEAKGRVPHSYSGTVHFNNVDNGNVSTHISVNGGFRDGSSIENFHVYAVEWNESGISWFVDGKQYGKTITYYEWQKKNDLDYEGEGDQYANQPFDKPFYVILNMAVGGTYDSGIEPPKSFTYGEMVIDFVRVYQYK